MTCKVRYKSGMERTYTNCRKVCEDTLNLYLHKQTNGITIALSKANIDRVRVA